MEALTGVSILVIIVAVFILIMILYLFRLVCLLPHIFPSKAKDLQRSNWNEITKSFTSSNCS